MLATFNVRRRWSWPSARWAREVTISIGLNLWIFHDQVKNCSLLNSMWFNEMNPFKSSSNQNFWDFPKTEIKDSESSNGKPQIKQKVFAQNSAINLRHQDRKKALWTQVVFNVMPFTIPMSIIATSWKQHSVKQSWTVSVLAGVDPFK